MLNYIVIRPTTNRYIYMKVMKDAIQQNKQKIFDI